MMNYLIYYLKICSNNNIRYIIIAQTPAITQARQAMLELIKSKTSTNNNTSKSKSKNKSGSGSSSDTEPTNRKNNSTYIDISRQNQFTRELDQKRRPANTVRLYGKVI